MSQLASAFIPAGTILPYVGGATATPPEGWLFCDGRPVSRNTYGDLFAAISTTYGIGDGTNTFNLPGGEETFFKGNGSALGGGSTHKHSYNTSMSINLAAGSIHSHTANKVEAVLANFPHNHNGAQNISANNANIQVETTNSNTATNPAVDQHTHSFGFAFSANTVHGHGGNASTVGHESSGHTVSVLNASDTPVPSVSVSSLSTEPNTTGPNHVPPYLLMWHIIKT